MLDNYYTQKYTRLLSRQFRNIQEVTEEIINLQAILNLPKGTEIFVSDIHGEYDIFSHILNNGAGIIKSKIEDVLGDTITESEMKSLATLIYYPEEKLSIMKKNVDDLDNWYTIILYRLIMVAKQVSSKYTRSKVRKALPQGFDYIIDELLNVSINGKDKDSYYKEIIKSIIELKRADQFIIAISDLIKRMAIDHLHIVGDIYDRGPKPKQIIDELIKFHSLDIQWGNHDSNWMGAACGNEACICNVVRICSRYDNLDTLENGYGINIRPLTTFALEVYKDDPCKEFIPITVGDNKYCNSDKDIISKVHKAITIIQFKIEAELIRKHPEYEMGNRLLLDKINYKNGTINIDGINYELKDKNFPTINSDNPFELTQEEKEVIARLKESFINSEILKSHITFLYENGGLYKIFNSNLLFHACIPINKDGEFEKVKLFDKILSGKEYLDYLETIMHKAYFKENDDENEYLDFMWYLWCGKNSPLFGKDKMATFENYFLYDSEIKKEIKNPYYTLINKEEICDKVLLEFCLNPQYSHIINGHTPVMETKGESPIRSNGKLLVIDGGFAKGYRNQTGNAGYILTYNSYGLVLTANEPFESKQKAIEEELDVQYKIVVKEKDIERKRVKDTDIGEKLKDEIEDLKILLEAYRLGIIKEKNI